jgi:hypothetical protein
MTTLDNRPHTALLVIDVQNRVIDGAHQRDTVTSVDELATFTRSPRAQTANEPPGTPPAKQTLSCRGRGDIDLRYYADEACHD